MLTVRQTTANSTVLVNCLQGRLQLRRRSGIPGRVLHLDISGLRLIISNPAQANGERISIVLTKITTPPLEPTKIICIR